MTMIFMKLHTKMLLPEAEIWEVRLLR